MSTKRRQNLQRVRQARLQFLQPAIGNKRATRTGGDDGLRAMVIDDVDITGREGT